MIQNMLVIVFVSVFTFADVVEPRDCHAFMRPPSCVVPYEYNILSLPDTSVDWKRYEYMSYVFVGRLSARMVETRREVQSLPRYAKLWPHVFDINTIYCMYTYVHI